MHEDPRRPPPLAPERSGVEGGEHDVAADLQPPSSGAPVEQPSQGGSRGEEQRHDDDRPGGMPGEAF